MTGSESIIQLSTKTSLYYHSKDVLFIVEEYRIRRRRKENRRVWGINTTSKCRKKIVERQKDN